MSQHHSPGCSTPCILCTGGWVGTGAGLNILEHRYLAPAGSRTTTHGSHARSLVTTPTAWTRCPQSAGSCTRPPEEISRVFAVTPLTSSSPAYPTHLLLQLIPDSPGLRQSAQRACRQPSLSSGYHWHVQPYGLGRQLESNTRKYFREKAQQLVGTCGGADPWHFRRHNAVCCVISWEGGEKGLTFTS